MTPKTVFSGTAISAMITVSQSAWSASGVVIAAKKSARPSSNARKTTSPTGTASSAPR